MRRRLRTLRQTKTTSTGRPRIFRLARRDDAERPAATKRNRLARVPGWDGRGKARGLGCEHQPCVAYLSAIPTR